VAVWSLVPVAGRWAPAGARVRSWVPSPTGCPVAAVAVGAPAAWTAAF